MEQQYNSLQPVPSTLIINGHRYVAIPVESERETREPSRLLDSLRTELESVKRENVRLQTERTRNLLLVRERSRLTRENRIFHEMLSKLQPFFPGHGTSRNATSGQLCLGYINRLCKDIVTRAQCRTIKEPVILRRYEQIVETGNPHLERNASGSRPGGAETPLIFTPDDSHPPPPILRRRRVAARHAVNNHRPTQRNRRMVDHSQRTATAINTIRRATSLTAPIIPGNSESDHNYVRQNDPDVGRQFHQASPDRQSQLFEIISID